MASEASVLVVHRLGGPGRSISGPTGDIPGPAAWCQTRLRRRSPKDMSVPYRTRKAKANAKRKCIRWPGACGVAPWSVRTISGPNQKLRKGGVAYGQACGGGRRRRSDGDDAGG